MSATAPLFSVVVPSRGDPARLRAFLAALDRQTIPLDRRELIVALDGVTPSDEVRAMLASAGARVVTLSPRAGPGAARNRGAAEARGAWLAFTEDDVTPADDWLRRAAERLAAEPALEALEGRTMKPGGRPVHRQSQDHPLYLPTNLFVRRDAFARVGGYSEDYYDAARGIYFREDADFGWTLEAAGARVGRDPAVCVTHPEEHAGALAPLRWAERHVMDPLLAARHPERFRDRLEVHRVGPLRVRRPIARASLVYVAALAAAAPMVALGQGEVARGLVALAAVAFLPVWAKWRFGARQLPACVLVPFVLTVALVRGQARARAINARSRPGTPGPA